MRRLTPVGRPQRLACPGIDGVVLARVASRETKEDVTRDDRCRIPQGQLGVLPDLLRGPLTRAPGDSQREQWTRPGDDDRLGADDRCDGVRYELMDHRPLPEQRAGGRIDADDLGLRRRDDLADAVERGDDWRSVARTVAGPAPAH